MCFCLGEIDSRCHVKLHCNATTTFEHVIDLLIAQYAKKLLEVRSLFASVTICVFMIPPPPKEGVASNWGAYPLRGTNAERLAYAQHFNTALQTMCLTNGFHFIEAYHEYADADGFLKPETSDNICHLKYNVPIQRLLETYISSDASS